MQGTHFFPLSEEQTKEIQRQRQVVEALIASGKTPDTYPKFVDGLFKEMDTPILSLVHVGMGMGGEGGEACDIIKKTWAYGRELDQMKLLKEIGDYMFYAQKALNMMGLTFDDVMYLNTFKLTERYHEGVYSDAQANARVDTKAE